MQPQLGNDEKAIRQLVADWMSASQAGDSEKVLSLMSDDVLFLLPGRAPMTKAEFRAGQKAMQGMTMEGYSDVQEVTVSGDLAYCWSKLSVTMTIAGQPPIKRAGNVLSVLRKESGRWVMFRDANMLTIVE